MRSSHLFTVLAMAAFFLAAKAPAGEEAKVWTPGEGEVSRRVLAVIGFRDLEFGDVSDSSAHTLLEKPLNHLGFALDYADPDKPLPDFHPYRAIMVWLYSYEMREAENFLPWLRAAMDAGVKLILPSGLDTPIDGAGKSHGELELEEILARFDLKRAPTEIDMHMEKMQLNYLRPEYYSYETNRFREDAIYPVFQTRRGDAGVEVWQRLENLQNPDRYAITAVKSDAGFWALSDNVLYFSFNIPGVSEVADTNFRVSWNINPWIMLRQALECDGMPAPDATTFSGTRGAYSHVDADGPYNMTQPDVPGPSRFAIDVLLNEIWKKYDFPVTIAPIAAEFDPDLDLRFASSDETLEESWAKPRPEWEKPQSEVAARLREYAKEIFALPYVQAGCHGYTHLLEWYPLFPGYAIPGYRPNYEMETRGAVEYLNKNVLPPEKPVEIYQWPGDCRPPIEALAILSDMGLENINGGDPMYDSRFNSIYYISPLSIPKGGYRQIYASACNENIYTEHWLGFKGGFNNVIATFEKSESPLRLLPVNIYYHVFPAESLAGLRAIRNAYDWAKKQDLCWITALEYARAARDSMAARVGRTGDGGWWVEEYNSCRTFRFDAEDRWLDIDASLNVAGFSHHNGSLYVSLLPGERAEIRFADREPDQPCLSRASGLIRNVKRGDGFWQGECRSWSKGFIELWAPEGKWRASVSLPGGKAGQVPTERLSDGRLRLNLPGGAGKWIGIRLEN